MIGSIRQKPRGGFREERLFPAIAFRQNNLVKEFYVGVLGAGGLALVDELVEGLGLAEEVHVLAVAVRDAAQELVHVEVVEQAGFATVA